MHYGWSWTQGHAAGWETALRRIRAEAKAAGANAVLDVKMRTIPLAVPNSMDFTLVGTAVTLDGLPPSDDPVVATVPALEFVKLLEADVVPTGIAIGAQYEWMADYYGQARRAWMGNIESTVLSKFWNQVRTKAHAELRRSAKPQGNGVLAHVNFSQMFEVEGGRQPAPPLPWPPHRRRDHGGRPRPGVPFRHDIGMVVDMRQPTPLKGTARHHQSYGASEREGPI